MKNNFSPYIISFLMALTSLADISSKESPKPDKKTSAKEKKNSNIEPYVTCQLYGQLGNQMCQIATALAYAWDHGLHPIFPELNKKEYYISSNRDRVFFRLDSGSLPRQPTAVCEKVDWWNYTPIPYAKDMYIKGTWFCWKNFHHHRNKLVETFTPSDEVLKYIKDKYSWLLEHPKTVSIHVRTYNKYLHECKEEGFPFLGMDFYKKAMDCFPDDTLFVVFSDRLNWCKQHFSQIDKNIYFAEGNDYLQDFYLMSMLRGHIVGNSEFSWWAAYLDEKADKVVVAPKYWYWRYHEYLPTNKTFLLMPDWIVIENDPRIPYPEDMLLYDKLSRSIDTQ